MRKEGEGKETYFVVNEQLGTVTEIYDFLRLLYARVGEAYSYNTGKKMVKFSEEEIVSAIFVDDIARLEKLLGWDCSDWKVARESRE